MAQKKLKLAEFLPYRLSITTSLVSDAIAQAYSRLFDLTVPEWRLIAVIAECDTGITQQQLVGRTRMDKVTVSRAAIALAGRGLIVRSPNPQDGRSQFLRLSGSGKELYRKVAPRALDLESRIFDKIASEDADRFVAMLETISQRAEQLLNHESVERSAATR